MSSSTKASRSLRAQSSSSPNPMVNETGIAQEGVFVEAKRGVQSIADNDKAEFENTFEDTDRQSMEEQREFSVHSKVSEYVPQDKEQVRGGLHQRDQQLSPSESVRLYKFREEGEVHSSSTSRTPRHTEVAVESVQGFQREVEVPPNTTASDVPSASQTTEFSKHYEALSRQCEFLQGELQAKRQRLEDKDSCIRSLKADISALQRRNEEQFSALTSARHELRSYQSQLDNVQRFISTADTHADQDIIQMLQGLNEEVYRTSMTMADYVAEGFTRQNATAHQAKHISIGENILATIGQVTVNYLAAVENGDVALFLQIAFQGYLSHLLCHIVSSWTVDQKLNGLIEGTYRRLRKAETQAIFGRWRCLTRTHILPTLVSDPKVPVEYAIAGLSDIVMAAGFVSLQCDAASKLSSVFGEKILSIVSRAGRFGNMVSEMISGDFEVFAIYPGDMFDGKSMMDMNEDKRTPRGTGASRTVLCASRVGLRKQVGEKTIMLTKAQVVLKSFLG